MLPPLAVWKRQQLHTAGLPLARRISAAIADPLSRWPFSFPVAVPIVAAMSLFNGHHLACRRGGRLVFAELSFALPPGSALVLIGPNGSGKSSLLRLMAGLSRPETGHLDWNGTDIADDAAAHRNRLRWSGHLDAIKPTLNVAQNLRPWFKLRGGSAPSVETALDRFDIGRLADIPARYLSAGQRRRLGLARILDAPAALWLLDEPTLGLDRSAIGLLETEIARHRADGGIVVLSTHSALDLPDAQTLAPIDFAPVL